jgi:hypothetical protein
MRTPLAFDRSMRRKDADGHLHVEMTNISKANVCPYFGKEIPDSEALGLNPNRVYMLYRDPTELKAAAQSFENKPLLMHHVPVSADEPARDLWVGVVGAPAHFEGVYLRAPISVWTQEGIDLIESKEQEQLSSAYRYRADMSPGVTSQGVAYDGVMRDIIGNHVALVAEGRAGPDVVVADESPKGLRKMRFPKFFAALAAAVAIKPEAVVALDKALDEEMDADLTAAMDAMSAEEKAAACDAYSKACGKAMDAFSDEDKTEAYKRAAKDKRAADAMKAGNAAAPAAPEGGAPKPAQDSTVVISLDAEPVKAAIAEAVAAAKAEATKDYILKVDAEKLATDAAVAATAAAHALFAARAAVESTVGIVALDSAEAVYRFALDHLKVEHKEIDAGALSALYDATVKAVAMPTIAKDAAAVPVNVSEIFTGLSNIRKG